MSDDEQSEADRLSALAELQGVLDAQGADLSCGAIATETVSADAIRAITESIRSLGKDPTHP